jgi:hypothetical protein
MALCYCGHLDDEHDGEENCTIEGCRCVAFEQDEEEKFLEATEPPAPDPDSLHDRDR